MKLRWWLIVAVGLVLCCGVRVSLAQTGSPPLVVEPQGIDYTPEVPIPGLFEDTIKIDNTTLATYLRAVYVYFIWIVGVLATVMVIYGGIKWVSAAGNPSRINDAREQINNAIIGVIIGLTSVVMLNIIDPSYTRLGLPDLQPVKNEQFGEVVVRNPDGSCKTAEEIPCGYGCTSNQGTIFGNCKYCDSSAVEPDRNHCGFSSQDPVVTAKNGRCEYTRCAESSEVCEYIDTGLTGTSRTHACGAQPRLPRLAEAGYGDLAVEYDRGFTCATIHWHQDGFPPFEVEKLKVGNKCEGGKNCLVDYTVSPRVNVRYSEIPNGADKHQIGQFTGSCY